jgi:hypothetical protein
VIEEKGGGRRKRKRNETPLYWRKRWMVEVKGG